MKYSIKPIDGNILVVEADTLLYGYENNKLLREIEGKIEEGHNRFIISLANIDYINSLGLSLIISVLTKSRNTGGETIVCCVNSKIDQVLAMMKLKSIFTICDNLEVAIEAFKKEEEPILS